MAGCPIEVPRSLAPEGPGSKLWKGSQFERLISRSLGGYCGSVLRGSADASQLEKRTKIAS